MHGIEGGERSAEPASGRFVLRLDPGLHAALRRAAQASGLSLNDYCARKLAAPLFEPGGPAEVLVARALSAFGADLVGMVAYGSWARGEAATDSDLDVLVALSPDLALARERYRAWDEAPPQWQGRRIEVHLAHLPRAGAGITSTWAEVALDGLVLFDPDFALARSLAAIRRRIVTGALQRRSAHGQPYWLEPRDA